MKILISSDLDHIFCKSLFKFFVLPTSKHCVTFTECQIYIDYIGNTFVCTKYKTLELLDGPVYQSLCLVSAQKKRVKFIFSS